MNILIVEDDDYKLERIKFFVTTELGAASIKTSESLKEALEAISNDTFDLIFVDMAIPSHPSIAGQGTAVSFNTGGLEVIMELSAMGRDDPCIIITQYPDIEISGEYVPISLVKQKLPALLECEVAACVLYEEESDDWKVELRKVLGELF
jgi:CheY-like chemotaxis protein